MTMKITIGNPLRSDWRYLPMFANQRCNFSAAESIVPTDDIEYYERYNSPFSGLDS